VLQDDAALAPHDRPLDALEAHERRRPILGVGHQVLLGRRARELGGAARQQRRLARTRCARHHDRLAGPHAPGQEGGSRRGEHVARHQLVEAPEGHTSELADVHHDVAATADVPVDDVHARRDNLDEVTRDGAPVGDAEWLTVVELESDRKRPR